MYNLLARGIEQEFLPMAREFGLGVVPYNPLAGGMLTGKHRADVDPAGTRFEKMPVYKDRYWHPANFRAVRQLTEIAAQSGKTVAGLAYGWLLAQAGVESIIVGASRLEQLQENVAVAQDDPLPQDVLAACDEVWGELRGVNP